MKKCLISILFLSSASPALENAYLSLKQPDGYSCELKSGVWVCRGKQVEEEGILLSVAVRRGGDTLTSLETLLNKERLNKGKDGKFTPSRASRVARVGDPKAPWIEATLVDFPRPGWKAELKVAILSSEGNAPLVAMPIFLLPPHRSSRGVDEAERTLASVKPQPKMRAVALEWPNEKPSELPNLLDFIVSYVESQKLLGP